MLMKKTNDVVTVFLGGDSSMEGSLKFNGQARVDGPFKGSIEGTGRLLVGQDADIEANIKAEEVIISGKVTGEIIAEKRIELKSPGRLKGNISAPLVVMDEGVWFEGHCTMAGSEMPKIKGKKVTLLPSRD